MERIPSSFQDENIGLDSYGMTNCVAMRSGILLFIKNRIHFAILKKKLFKFPVIHFKTKPFQYAE
jgi:hypothetical protein